MQNSDPTRVFVVGCPRSGTTLIQALLCTSPEIISFTESHFFGKYPCWNSSFAKPSLPQVLRNCVRKRHQVNRWLAENGFDAAIGYTFDPDKLAMRFLQLLDEEAVRRGATFWVEKTPRHLHFIETISSLSPNTRFVHVIRNPKDTVASLVSASKQWSHPYSVQEAAKRWFQDYSLSLAYSGAPQHKVVRYEDILSKPEEVAGLFDFLSLSAPPNYDVLLGEVASEIVHHSESWKNNNFGPILSGNVGTYKNVLTDDEQKYVESLFKGYA